MIEQDLSVLQEKIGYSFRQESLLIKALSHSSYVNEQGLDQIQNNERLEFLGDAVLETVTSEVLYHLYPLKREGELSKLRASLVCEPSLAACAVNMGLDGFILLGYGEEKTGGRGRKSIISDCMEALIGAIFLDGGMDSARAFVNRFVLNDIEHANFFSDNKSALQEALAVQSKVPSYQLISETGPSHERTFTVQVRVGKSIMGVGSAHSKKEAEQIAAGIALEKYRKK